MEKQDQEVYVLLNEFSRMGPDDEDLCDAWLEKFDGYRKLRFKKEESIKNWPEKVVFWANWTYDQTDLLKCDPDWPVFSPKLLKLFEDNKIPLRKFPITLIREGGGKKEVHEDYHAIQLACHHDLIDMQDSVYTMDEYLPNTIEFLRKLVLRRPSGGFPLVFRLWKEPTEILVNREMKQKLEAANIKGIQFKTIDEVFTGVLTEEQQQMIDSWD